MRKVSMQIAKAFKDGEPLEIAKSNTETDGVTVYLHGHAIIWKEEPYTVYTLAGYPTNVTRTRLNDIAECLGHSVRFYQKGGEQYVTRNIGADKKISASELVVVVVR